MADTDVKRHPLVEDYLSRLQAAARTLPRGERKDLVADTEAYLAQAIKPDADAIELRGMLGAPGTPEVLVAQDRPKQHKPDPEPMEGSASVLVAVGGLLLGGG